jgi:alpha-glucoside transport system substrate-binding protein
MAFNDTPAVRSLIKYLSSDLGGKTWAEVGFDLTPNAAGAMAYIDPQLLKKAEILSSATNFTADIGDSIPGGFGSAEFKGITDFVNGADLDAVLATIAAAQKDAMSK